MEKKVHIVIVEDQTLVREALKSLIEKEPDLEVIGEAEDGLEALRIVRQKTPDMVLLDLAMPKMHGLSVIKEIRTQYPDTKIVVLTFHTSEEYILSAFDSGANAYCLKNDSHAELLTAIRNVLQGRTHLSSEISERVLEGYLEGKKTLRKETAWDSLTQREKEVLKLVGEGYTSSEIAEMLHISPKTVDKHRSNIMNKLDRHSAAELTSYAVRKGLVTQ